MHQHAPLCTVLAVLMMAMMFGGSALADPLEEGDGSYHRGDDVTALRLFRPLADDGNSAAQFGIGNMYDRGRGVSQDYAEARKWYRKAAAQGNALAQTALGFMYFLGKGVPQDYAEAIKWYHNAAEQGDGPAQRTLGVYARFGARRTAGLRRGA